MVAFLYSSYVKNSNIHDYNTFHVIGVTWNNDFFETKREMLTILTFKLSHLKFEKYYLIWSSNRQMWLLISGRIIAAAICLAWAWLIVSTLDILSNSHHNQYTIVTKLPISSVPPYILPYIVFNQSNILLTTHIDMIIRITLCLRVLCKHWHKSFSIRRAAILVV